MTQEVDADDARFRTLVRALGKLVTEPDLEARLGRNPAAWLLAQGVGAEGRAQDRPQGREEEDGEEGLSRDGSRGLAPVATRAGASSSTFLCPAPCRR